MNYRKHLVRAATFLGGIYFFLEFVLPGEIGGVALDQYHEQITLGFLTVGAMAVGLGLINLLMVHGSRVVFLKKGLFNSGALLIGLAAMIALTSVDWVLTSKMEREVRSVFALRDFARKIDAAISPAGAGWDAELPRINKLRESVESLIAGLHQKLMIGNLAAAGESLRQALRDAAGAVGKLKKNSGEEVEVRRLDELAEALNTLGARYSEFLNAGYEGSFIKKLYGLLYQGLFVPLGSAMFSLLGFYMAVAAYRAFRVRSTESALMMCAAVLVMLGQIPFGIWLWEGFPDLRLWLLRVPNSAAFRGIAIGASVAGLVMAFRMWLSIESESFSKDR